MKKIFFDMDGVLAEYKIESSESDMAKRGYFYNLKPEQNVIDALNMLIKNGDEFGLSVCVLTKVYPTLFKYSVREKLEWRDKHLPNLFDSEFIMVNGELEEKSDAVKTLLGAGINADYILIDDYNQNLAEWKSAGGGAIKFVNGINDKNKSFIGNRLSFDMTAEEIYYSILEFAGVTEPTKAAA